MKTPALGDAPFNSFNKSRENDKQIVVAVKGNEEGNTQSHFIWKFNIPKEA